MSNYRPAALALVACAASLSVAACAAGITTASSAPTSAPAPTRSASVAAAASSPASSASSGRRIAISGSPGTFPVPAGAKVAENVAADKEIIVFFSSVAPAQVSSFYATALPLAGYVISGNSVISEGSGTEAIIQFSGHGYKGNIATLSHFSGSGVSVAGLGTKNVTTISLMRK
jgi:hypothetical protein